MFVKSCVCFASCDKFALGTSMYINIYDHHVAARGTITTDRWLDQVYLFLIDVHWTCLKLARLNLASE
jgi:hypothetical protein